MPKVVDHDQRRREIAEAVLRVVVRDGVVGASVRSVAAEAGWSTGSLRYYFGTQAELRDFAVWLVAERVEQRIREYLAGRGAGASLLDRAAGIAEQLIPLDEERREEYQWWLAVAEWRRQGEHAAIPLWSQQRDLYRQIVYRIAGFPDEPLQHGDDLHPEVERWAEYLHVFVDGLAAQAMFVPADMPTERVRTVLRDFLGRIPAVAGAGSGEHAHPAGSDQQADDDENDSPKDLPAYQRHDAADHEDHGEDP